MIESIDSLLGILNTQNGKELRLEVGHRVQMITPAGVYDLSATPLTPADIGTAIGPIVPDTVRTLLSSQREVEFNYGCPGAGPFKVLVWRGASGYAARFMPGSSAAPSASASGPLNRPAASASGPLNRPAASASGPLNGPPVSASGPLDRTAAPQPRPAADSPFQVAPPPPRPVPNGRVQSGGIRMEDLFQAMFAARASDLHISVSMPPMLRVDGQMAPIAGPYEALTPEETRRLLTSIMPQKNVEEFERRKDTDFAHEIPGLARFRANIFMDRKGMGGVFRVIPNELLTAEKLGLSPHILKLCKLSKGLVLVTGPTGSGKSTTLCALVDFINRSRDEHVITIEDPIEFVHENKKCLINQREVHNHTDSFKDALRAALREDPDIVLVGEMRDLETVAIAIETAETGHLVFGTLHTTTAASTVDRIIDQFPPDRQTQIRVMLSESLRGVISQTLLRKKGGGRIAALEVLIITPAISNLIREGKTFQIPSSMQTGRAIGMVTLNDALIELVKSNTVEAEEAYVKAVDKSGFEALLKRHNLDTKFIQSNTAPLA